MRDNAKSQFEEDSSPLDPPISLRKSSSAASPAPATASAYLDPKYWNDRFAEEDHYEWFKDYSHFQHLIGQYVKASDSVLEVGCGNSRLCEGLHGDGVMQITCTDLSAVAVERMQRRLTGIGLEGITVMEADMLDLPFADECFDVVIEKGSMDVLFVDSGDPWNPNRETVEKVMAMLKEIHRVLKPDGVFISISFGQPHFRRPFFEASEFSWSFKWHTFGEGFHYFFYASKKGKRLDLQGLDARSVHVPSFCMMHDELEGEDYIFHTNVDEFENSDINVTSTSS